MGMLAVVLAMECISCSGVDADNISSDRVVYVTGNGEFCGDIKPPQSGDTIIYKKQESANAVVHTHSDYCVALACHNLPLPGFHYMVGLFGNTHVPVCLMLHLERKS